MNIFARVSTPLYHYIFQMGYANVKQRGQGLHLRQFSRAFVIDDEMNRVVFVSVDGAMISHAVKRDVSISLRNFDKQIMYFRYKNQKERK